MKIMMNTARDASDNLTSHKTPMSHQRQTINQLGIVVLFVAFLAGKFSLVRIDDRFEYLGGIAYVAYWFVPPLLLLVLLSLNWSRYHMPVLAPALSRSFGAFALSTSILNIYMALSSAWAMYPDIDLANQLLLVVVLLAVTCLFLRWGTEKQLNLILIITFGSGLVYAAGSLAGGLDVGRLAAFGGGPNVFVRVTGSGLVAGLYLFFAQRKRFVIWAFPVLLLAALGSGSRGGAIGLAVSVLFVALFVLPLYYRWRTIFWVGIVLIISAWITYSLIRDSELMRTIWLRYVVLTEQGYLAGRDIRMSAAWYLFLDRPWIGAGLNGFKSATGFPDYPHNLLLQVASEGGILGLIPLLIGLVLLIYRWFQPRSVEHDFVLAICLLYFVASQISGQIYDARFAWFYGLAYMLPKRQTAPITDVTTLTLTRSPHSRPTKKIRL